MSRFIGIDFSGNHLKWRPGCTTSNVWIAEITFSQGQATLISLGQVQGLPGLTPPFDRLVTHLAGGNFDAAGIDAPFSVPDAYLPPGGHGGLLRHVAALPVPAGHPFPTGGVLAQSLIHRATVPFATAKPLRITEQLWVSQGLTIRSTLWAGRARPGAPMTAACLTLLHRVQGPIWPWATVSTAGLIVEAFPMAQLFQWGLPFTGYSGNDPAQTATRASIISGIQIHVNTTQFNTILQTNADALDAVVAGLAAIAVKRGNLCSAPGPLSTMEGWIAVHG